MTLINIPKNTARAGFSLVEVTLAVGIAALGIIAVLGLMPQGLEMSRRTGELTAHRQIAEQIVRDLEQRSWTDLGLAMASDTKYFDDQGAPTTLNAPTQAIIARVQVMDLTTGPALPLGGSKEPYLRKAVIKIATTTQPQFDFSDANQRNYATVVHFIAKAR